MAYNDFTHLDAVVTATIADSASLSSAVNLGKMTLVAIQTPAGMEGTAITFQYSLDGGTTFVDMYDEAGTEVNFPAGASRGIKITNANYFHGIQHIKVRTGTTASGSAQTGAAAITLGLVAI